MKGLLLINLGTPDDPSPSSVGRYLDQFLMDPRVLGAPTWLRSLLVRKLIVPKRSFRSAEKYKTIWTERGSPLKFHSVDLHEGVQKNLIDVPIGLAFRYGQPSIAEQMKKLAEQGVTDLLVLPLYPHYADSSVTTVWDEVQAVQSQLQLKLHRHEIFYNKDWFIDAWVKILKEQLEGYPADHILFSYHGIPMSHVLNAHPACRSSVRKTKLQQCPQDCPKEPCYIGQCHWTSQAIFRKLSEQISDKGLGFSTSFQSRLGPFRWTEPNTVLWLEKLFKKGIRRPLVACPSFVADCLETLEEIGIEERKHFLSLGGQDLKLSPCLNSHPVWVKGLSQNLAQRLESL